MLRFGLTAALALLGQPLVPLQAAPAAPGVQPSTWLDSSMGMLQAELTARYGAGQRLRIQRGLAQTARFWQAQDGGAGQFEQLVRDQFAGDPAALDALFQRVSRVLAGLDEGLGGIGRELAAPKGPGSQLPVQGLLGGLDPAAHLSEDGFASQLAFAVLLNFPLTTLAERTRDGAAWTRRQWAEAWLAERFSLRVPAGVFRAVAAARFAAERSLADACFRPDRLTPRGRRLYPPGSTPCREDPRNEIQAQYASGKEAVPRQRALQKALERIVAQDLPPGVTGDGGVDWDPFSAQGDPAVGPGERYHRLLGTWKAARMLDPYAPLAPTQIARSLEEVCQMPEARLRPLLETLCGSPLAARAGRLIRSRLGRNLEPFDLWYDGFRPGAWAAADLKALVLQRCPGARDDLAAVLQRLCQPQPGPQGEALDALSAFWSAWAASGAALVDLEVWHWLYAHPEADAAGLKAAVLDIARNQWNRVYAPVLGGRDCLLLASGRHLIDQPLGLPLYPLGQVMAFQVLRQAGASGSPEETFARCASLGRMTPDPWLQRAAGAPLGTAPLLDAAARAVKALSERRSHSEK